MNAEKSLLKWLILWVLLTSIIGCASQPIIIKEEKISTNDTSIPKEYQELIGKDIDYIQSQINVHFPDTVQDSSILHDSLDRFNPVPLDSGILVSDYDFAQCILFNSKVKYLKTHIEQQTKIQNAFIEGAHQVETLCKESVNDLNKSNKEIAKIANEERNRADMWKNTTFLVSIFAAGYLTSTLIR
jgi:hypothetical protein